MIIYYLKQVLRNTKKHKRVFMVNMLSLAFGIAIAGLLFVHVMYERSYDSFYKETGNLFRVNYNVRQGGRQIVHSCRTQSALSWALPGESQLVEASCRAYYENCYMYTDNVKLYNQKVVWADKDFLKVFQNEMLIGDQATALENKYSVVISDKTAQIYFGKSDPVGKTIRLNEGMTFTVTGVFKSIPQNSHLGYDFITSFITFEDYGIPIRGSWDDQFPSTYIRKKDNATQQQLETDLAGIARKYLVSERHAGTEAGYSLTPVKDIYLHSDFEGEFRPMGNAKKVALIGIIALFIMVVAWANNVNISTSFAFERAKESGIRKLNGAGNKELFTYFITETLFVNLTAVVLSLLIILIALPFFKVITGGEMIDNFMLKPWFWKSIGLVIVSGVIFTGILPSVIQVSFNPIMVLKKQIGQKTSLNVFRASLSVFQFSLAILLIVATILIIKQINFLQKSDLGMKPSQVLVMRGPATNNTSGNKRYIEFCSFRDDLLRSSYFKSLTATMNVPGQINRFSNVIVSRHSKKIDKSFNISQADDQYFQTYQVPLIEGRTFYSKIENERDKVIVNERAVYALGFESPGQAISQKIEFEGRERQIIGVVRNFHHESLQKEIEPYLYTFEHPGEFGYYPALISTTNVSEAVKIAGEIWKKHYPDAQFEYFFLDDYFNSQYLSYKQLGQLAGVGSLFAIIIACLGLYSISSYTVNKRTREIGIRKVNGARESEILTMLNRDFVKWVAIAFVTATPVAYYAMHKWLENFAYKTTLSWWIFAMAGAMALGIALFTVSFQSWKAAAQNPVKALTYE